MKKLILLTTMLLSVAISFSQVSLIYVKKLIGQYDPKTEILNVISEPFEERGQIVFTDSTVFIHEPNADYVYRIDSTKFPKPNEAIIVLKCHDVHDSDTSKYLTIGIGYFQEDDAYYIYRLNNGSVTAWTALNDKVGDGDQSKNPIYKLIQHAIKIKAGESKKEMQVLPN